VRRTTKTFSTVVVWAIASSAFFDPGAREHRDRQLGDHRHVDRDPVALPDAQLLERVRAALGLIEEVLVRERARVARLALPVVRHLRALAGLHVAVEAVLRDVQLAIGEPLRVGRLPLEDLRERPAPRQGARLLGPEAFEVRVGPVVDRRIARVRLPDEVACRREGPRFAAERVEC